MTIVDAVVAMMVMMNGFGLRRWNENRSEKQRDDRRDQNFGY
jgi:hypothetical protein